MILDNVSFYTFILEVSPDNVRVAREASATGALVDLFLFSNPGMQPPGFERVRRWYFKGEIAVGAVLRHARDMLLQPLLQ